MKGLGALTFFSLAAAVSAAPQTLEKRTSNCGVCYHIFPQDKVDPVYPTLSKDGSVLPDYTNVKPVKTGITKRLHFKHALGSKNAAVKVYKSDFNQPWYTIIDHKFYVKACYAGKITFTFVGAQDDMTALWVGDKAYKGFYLPQADLTRFWADKRGAGDATFTVDITTPSTYIPVRLVSMNGDGPAEMKVRVSGPVDKSGKIGCLIGPDNDTTKDIFYKCPAGSKSYTGTDIQEFPAFPFSLPPPPPPPVAAVVDDGYGGGY